MKIALAQLNSTIGDFYGNFLKARDTIKTAREQGCDIVIFPELFITGYPPQDLLLKRSFIRQNLQTLNDLVEHARGITVLIGYVEPNEGSGRPLFNSCAIIQDGRLLHPARKQLLPTYDVFDEDRYFEPALGHRVIEVRGMRIGVTICEDIWADQDVWTKKRYHNNPVTMLIQDGIHLLVNISASPYSRGKIALRDGIVRKISAQHNVYTCMVNLVGANDELIFDGSSRVYGPGGQLLYASPSFEEDVHIIELERATPISPPKLREIENVYRALILGIRDYTRKCGFSRVIIGVSGGIDSAVTLTLACDALGPEKVMGVFMPTRFTSQESYEDARELARNLGCHWVEIPIDSVFECFLQRVREVYKQPRGVTEENLQARIRGNILMTLSNQYGALVLSTGNKSELALGYCTLYGDMTGGLAVIGDVPKTMVYELGQFMNEKEQRIPERIFIKPPSAELRENQKDEDDIPPYALVDQVIHMYIEQEKSVDEIIAHGIPKDTVLDIVRRIDRNEYKRRQAPPTLKVTHRAFGMGRRLPIAQRFRHDVLDEK